MSTPDKQQVRVNIFHQNFTLLASGDPRELADLAHDVDALMQTIASRSPSGDSARIAILACLHLADQLRSINQKSERFAHLLDEVIEAE